MKYNCVKFFPELLIYKMMVPHNTE